MDSLILTQINHGNS